MHASMHAQYSHAACAAIRDPVFVPSRACFRGRPPICVGSVGNKSTIRAECAHFSAGTFRAHRVQFRARAADMPRALGPRRRRPSREGGNAASDPRPKVRRGPRGMRYTPERVLGRGSFGTAYIVSVRAEAGLPHATPMPGSHWVIFS